MSPAEAFLQLVDERDGDVLVNWPFLNDDLGAVETMLRHPDSVLGLADAGAHVGMIMDSSQPTFFLTYWIRDRGLCDDRRGDPPPHLRHRGPVRGDRPRRPAARARSPT